MIKSIAHNALKVTDMERSLDFYCNTIGLEKAFDISDDNGKPWIVYLKICKNAFIELFYDGVKDHDPAYDFKNIGYHHFCISVGDIQNLADRLYEKNIIESPKPSLGKDQNLSLWINDPDGNAVEFVQYTPESLHMKSNHEAVYHYETKGFTGIGHMAFSVDNMEETLRLYRDVLEFEKIHEFNDDNGKPWLVYLRVKDGSYIELFYGATEKINRKDSGAGFLHICLECDDVYTTVAELQKKNIKIDIAPMQGKDKNCQAWITDPDGNRIELMTIDPDSPQAKV